MTLSELIVDDPEPIKKIIQKTGRKPIYFPWFSRHMETEAAEALGADLFGASESLTLNIMTRLLLRLYAANWAYLLLKATYLKCTLKTVKIALK